ncbi:MAG: lipid-A-disaccharide synthase [Gammaproteobacteria bacterium]|nr:lipid-A-disaccharide synthase [Gammaproteobacteria bacterium]
MSHAKKIFISAGEASGDMHAAKLVRELLTKDPTLEFIGMGGSLMRQAGVNIIVDSSRLAFVGLVDVLLNFWRILQTLRQLRKELVLQNPDLVILIDFPGFNLPLAKAAKKVGRKVLYYISPQLWAWRKNRIHKIKKYVDQMAVILPFEVDLYEKAQVKVAFVGHPLVDTAKPTLTKLAAKEKFGLSQNAVTIGLLPGSRHSEIKYLLPPILKAAELLAKHFPNVQFVLPLASSLSVEDLAKYLDKSWVKIHLIKNNTYDAINVCDAAVVASGTATLETTLLNIPFVLIYRGSLINYLAAKMVVQISRLGLCNIIANDDVVIELHQYAVTPKNIYNEIKKILKDENYRLTMQQKMLQIRNLLAPLKKQQQLTDVVLKMLEM